MAITKLMHMKESKSGSKSSHLKNAIDYILKDEKVAISEGLRLAGTNACMLDFAYRDMMDTKRMYGKETGRQGYHFVISFRPGQATKDQVFKIAKDFIAEYLSDYECVYAVHNDQEHLHAHIVFNSVSYQTGLKYHYKNGDWEKIIQPIVDRLCVERGLQPLEYHIDEYENNVDKKQYFYYSKNFNWTKEIKADIDECINKSRDWKDFILYMKDIGYTFNFGKFVSIKKEGMSRVRRLKDSTVGMPYTPEGIITRIKIKNNEIKLCEAIPSIKSVGKLPESKYVKPKFKKYKDMTFEEKVMIRQMLRIRNVIPEYKKYPGAWYTSRKVQELHRVSQELIMTKKYNIHNKSDLSNAFTILEKKQKEIKKSQKMQDFMKENYKELIDNLEIMENYELGLKSITQEEYKKAEEKIMASGETREGIKKFVNQTKENESRAQSELKNIKKQKNALNRIKKKQEVNEKSKNNKNVIKKEREVKQNGRRSRIN